MTPLQISPLLLPEYVLGDGTGFPRTPAILDASTGRRLEFDQLYDSVWRAASSLVDLGLKPGDVCAIYSRN